MSKITKVEFIRAEPRHEDAMDHEGGETNSSVWLKIEGTSSTRSGPLDKAQATHYLSLSETDIETLIYAVLGAHEGRVITAAKNVPYYERGKNQHGDQSSVAHVANNGFEQ